MSYLVIDTEGKPNLKEIALIDSSGQLIYHAYTQEHSPHHPQPKPLAQIVTDLQHLTQDKTLVFHYAEHDLKILKQAFKQAHQPWIPNPILCTCETAKKYLPNLPSYSLEHLSLHLGIQLESGYFNPNLAHDASYDALFTYHLYRHLIHTQLKAEDPPNPFANSKVDNPFQTYPDETTTYHPQYQQLTAALQDIQRDPNHQSRGVVLLGEPGSGKTHLIMRVAQNLLRNNRLLFIRQPTHPDNIYHHIYSRTLESLIEPVDGTHTQLDYLIAKSFVEILKTRQLTPKAAELLTLLDADPLNLFHRLGSEGTTRRRSYWQAIEIQVIRWWSDRHFFTGASENILKGIIKYCSYSDRHRRDIIIRWLSGTEVDPESAAKVNLPLWSEQLTPNSFALQGMTILGHLSLLDNPLIIVFDQLEALGLPANQDILLNFGETLKELFTHVPNSLFILNLFPDRWQHFQTTFDGSITDRIGQHQIQLHPPSEAQLKILLQQRFAPAATCRIPATPIEALFPADDLQDMLSQPSIRKAINRAADYYRFHINGIPLPLQIQESSPTPDDWQTRIQRLETDLAQVKAALQKLLPDLQLSNSPPTESPAQRPEDSDTPPPQILTPDPIAALLDPYLQASEAAQNTNYAKATIITDEDDIGKLRRICEALKTLYPLDMTVLSYRKRVLPQHLFLPNTKRVIGFLQSTGNSFTSRLKNFNELVISHPNLTFLLLRDPRQTPITTKVATHEVEKLNNRPNGSFQPLTQPDRLHLEVLAQLQGTGTKNDGEQRKVGLEGI